MGRIIRLTERDLTRLVKRIIMEVDDKPHPKEGDYGVYCTKGDDSLTSIANKFKGQYGLSNDDPISDILSYNEYYRQILSKIGKKQRIGNGVCLYLYAAG